MILLPPLARVEARQNPGYISKSEKMANPLTHPGGAAIKRTKRVQEDSSFGILDGIGIFYIKIMVLEQYE